MSGKEQEPHDIVIDDGRVGAGVADDGTRWIWILDSGDEVAIGAKSEVDRKKLATWLREAADWMEA